MRTPSADVAQWILLGGSVAAAEVRRIVAANAGANSRLHLRNFEWVAINTSSKLSWETGRGRTFNVPIVALTPRVGGTTLFAHYKLEIVESQKDQRSFA